MRSKIVKVSGKHFIIVNSLYGGGNKLTQQSQPSLEGLLSHVSLDAPNDMEFVIWHCPKKQVPCAILLQIVERTSQSWLSRELPGGAQLLPIQPLSQSAVKTGRAKVRIAAK
jgi:hypothetical protein